MTTARLPTGIVSVVQTPFRRDGTIDESGLERLVEDAIAAGVNGLLTPVVASEVAWLTKDERRRVVQRVAATARGRVPLVVGASADAVPACREMAALAKSVEAAAYLVAVPASFYAAPDNLIAYFQKVTAGNNLPLIVQDLQWNGPGLEVTMIARLHDALPTLAGVKVETSPAGPKYTAVRQVLGADFYIAGGWAITQMIEALDRGVDAMIPESSMIRVYRAILREHTAGRRDNACRIFRALLPVLAFSNQEIATSVAFFKRLLVRKGIFQCDALRMTGFAWDRYNRRIADDLIEHYLALERDEGVTTSDLPDKPRRKT